jgi:hypothetical protein
MDLYQPLYVPRPVVEPELFASLRPPTYSGDLHTRSEVTAAPKMPPRKEEAEKLAEKADKNKDGEGWGLAIIRGTQPVTGGFAGATREKLDEKMDLGRIATAASAARLGDFFQYAIDKPVTLPRQKSALLPIANKDVEGTRVSIYNERTQAKFPLLGLRFKNTSGLHLMQGPVTVFEGSNYAGDARFPDLQPNEQRLISYAIDLGTEVNPVPASDNGKLTSVKVNKGILHTTTKVRESKTYTVANRNDQERLVLIEHPVRNEFKLVDTDKPAETASDVYRFEVKAPAGKSATLTVLEERVIAEAIQLTNSNDDQMRFFFSSPISSAKVKEALGRALELKGALERTRREIQEQERQLKAITDDQVRLRANLKEMPSTAAAYKRYLEKFDDQETQIEKLQADVKALQATEHGQRKAYEDYLNGLTVE